jgi:hypothetical protein
MTTRIETLRNSAALPLRVIAVLSSIALLSTQSAESAPPAETEIRFTDVRAQTGITFEHRDGSSGQYYIMETVSAGLALFDYDDDGDVDIYFLNGAALQGTTYDPPPINRLYRNDGNWKFTDVTEESGTGDRGFGLGVAVGDYNRDGHLDLYLNNYGPNVLYRNNGDGTFSDVAEEAKVTDGDHVGGGAAFLDIDEDGDLDLYSAHYVDFSYTKNVVDMIRGNRAYMPPTAYPYSPDSLYRNNGDGTFTDVSESSGIAAHAGTGMGMVCADYDNDGDTDIFVANDLVGNFLFANDGTGRFEEVGLQSGVAYDFFGKAHGSMGVDCADYDNDGLLDFYVTSYAKESATLYRNLGNGLFEDVTSASGAGAGTYINPTWGTGFADFDHDGDRDLFVAVGHTQPNIAKSADGMSYWARNEVLMNTGDGKFVNVTDQCGDGLKVELSSRGAGFDDLDNDGDIDAVVLNSRREATILRNDTQTENHWIQIRLKGVTSAPDGVGARVKVTRGDRVQIDEVHSGRGYQGHHGLRLHFGLGSDQKVDRIEVDWIGGAKDVLRNVAADQLITITEGTAKSE